MPGVYKLLILFLIQHFYGLNILGDIASWQSIAQILSYFTAIGWSSLILVRIAKAKTTKERIEEFNRLSMMGGVTLLTVIFSLLLTSSIVENTEDALQITYWLVAWTMYQLPRHYLIALREYRKALLLDATVISLSIFSLIIAQANDASLLLSASMMTGGLASFYFIQKTGKASLPKFNYDIKGLEFGLVNFLSGGISLSLIPLASYFEGKSFAGAISLFISISAIALLLPRAISLNQLPTLANVVHNSAELAQRTRPMRSQIRLSNILTTLACIVIGAIVLVQTKERLAGEKLALCLLLITLQSTVSIQSLVNSNILMAAEKSRLLLKINTITSIVFLSTTMLLHFFLIKNAFLHICIAILVLNLYRLHKTRLYAKPFYDSHPTL